MLTVLGGGPAGLAVAYAARRRGHRVKVYEAADRVGGNCITFHVDCRGQEYRFDSGAHRFHDKDPEVTEEVLALMGEELRRVDAPSQIYTDGRLIDFPFDPIRLPFQLGVVGTAMATADYLRRPRSSMEGTCFEELALARYGRYLAQRFLLEYSEKLWGAPCSRLSPVISGKRLQGLNLRATLLRALGPDRGASRHLEGSFLYPTGGYGRICVRLAEVIGEERIHTGRWVTGLLREGRRISHVELDGSVRERVETVCSTLPLDVTLRCLKPAAPETLLGLSAGLRFRSLVLVALFLDRPRITANATVYFPDPELPFTRVAEPRNRSPRMAPDGRTSLVAELPCFHGDELWTRDDRELSAEVTDSLSRLGWFRPQDVLGHAVRRLGHAYPVLDLAAVSSSARILDYLRGFENLVVGGRNGRFVYRHVHDMLRLGMDTVADLVMSDRRRDSVGGSGA